MQLVLILVFIVNSQLRFFTLLRYPYAYYPSLLLEGVLASLLYPQIGGFWFIYVAILLFDITTSQPLRVLLLMLSTLGGLTAIALTNVSGSPLSLAYDASLNVLCMGLIVLFGFYLKQEGVEKQRAQVLYDKLRTSEDELQYAYKQLQGYSATIRELSILRERNRISRELHDSVGHSISTLIIQLEAIKTASTRNSEQTVSMLENLILYARNSMENVRRAVRDMKPLELEDDSGLLAIDRLLETFKSFTMIDTQLIVSRERWSLTSLQSHNLYRIVQEALNNSAKHSKANKIVVSMNYEQGKLQVAIRDNGVGCAELGPSFGLASIRERVQELRGTLDINTAEGQGFDLYITVPREEVDFD